MLKLVAVLSLVAVCLAQMPSRPKISETFHFKGAGKVSGEISGTDYSGDGEIYMGEDDAKLRSMIFFEYNFGRDFVGIISLWQQKIRYTVLGKGANATCFPQQLTEGGYYSAFGWVEDAQYAGSDVIDDVQYDIWERQESEDYAEVWVTRENPNEPSFFGFYLPYGDGNMMKVTMPMEVNDFTTEAPPDSYFDTPKSCQ